MYDVKRRKRLSQARVHFLTAHANLFTDHRMSGPPIRDIYMISGQLEHILLTLHPPFPIVPS